MVKVEQDAVEAAWRRQPWSRSRCRRRGIGWKIFGGFSGLYAARLRDVSDSLDDRMLAIEARLRDEAGAD